MRKFLPEPVGCILYFSIDIHPVLYIFETMDASLPKKERNKAYHSTIVHHPLYSKHFLMSIKNIFFLTFLEKYDRETLSVTPEQHGKKKDYIEKNI